MSYRLRVLAVLFILGTIVFPSGSRAQSLRRINAGLLPVYYIFDEDYFGISSGVGMDFVLRYEIEQNIFIENRLGGYGARQEGMNITGLNGQLGVIAFFPVWIPYRPSARFALALMSANPMIADSVAGFRPSQTIFYMVTGLGMTRAIKGLFQIEVGADLIFTPYNYRVYDFYRQYYEVNEARFVHFSLSLGASYTF